MSSREKFEQAIKSRFGDSIDYRVCKNSDGEYMAWDMQVAWWAWQAAEADMAVQLANAESKCRELAGVAAENAALKKAADFATAPDMWIEQADGMLDYRYCEWYVDVLKAAMETPATDAFLAEVRASARNDFIGRIEWIIRNECNPDKTEAIINELQNFSDELKLEAAQ